MAVRGARPSRFTARGPTFAPSAYPGTMAYSKQDRIYIGILVGIVFALGLLVHACEQATGFRGVPFDDGGDPAAEAEEFRD